MNKKSSFSGTPGGSALLVIFAVLCLVVFAVLTLTTVLADGRLADASSRNVYEYYEADCAAEEIISRLRAGEVPPEVTVADGICSYSCPISASQALQVSVRLDGDQYEILSWQNVYTGSWSSDDSLTVWLGD